MCTKLPSENSRLCAAANFFQQPTDQTANDKQYQSLRSGEKLIDRFF